MNYTKNLAKGSYVFALSTDYFLLENNILFFWRVEK